MLQAALRAARRWAGVRMQTFSSKTPPPVLGGFASALTDQFGSTSSKMAGLSGVLLGCGNPLLDLSAVVDQSMLEKYGVRPRHARITPLPLQRPAHSLARR